MKFLIDKRVTHSALACFISERGRKHTRKRYDYDKNKDEKI